MDGRIADEHGKGGDELEVDERFEAETADFLEVGVAGDSNNEDAEEQRRDDDFDEAEKNGAEDLQVYRDRRPVVAQFRAREKADQDPSRQRAARGGIGGDEKERQPAQERCDKRGPRQDVCSRQERKRNDTTG